MENSTCANAIQMQKNRKEENQMLYRLHFSIFQWNALEMRYKMGSVWVCVRVEYAINEASKHRSTEATDESS